MFKDNQGFKDPICNVETFNCVTKMWKIPIVKDNIAQGLQDEDLSTIKFEVIKRKYD